MSRPATRRFSALLLVTVLSALGRLDAQSLPVPLLRPAAPATNGARIDPATTSFLMVDRLAYDALVLSRPSSLVVAHLPLPGEASGTLRLRRFDLIAPGGSIIARGEHGDVATDVDQGLFFTGALDELPGSWVYLAVFRDWCSGYIELPGSDGTKRRLVFAPLQIVDGRTSTIALYDERTALALNIGRVPSEWDCGAEQLPEYDSQLESLLRDEARREKERGGSRLQSNTLLAAQLAVDCDSAYYVAHGRNLSRASNYALTVLGSASAIYQRDINIQFQIPYLRVWTGGDPYPGTTLSALLGQFRNYWNANMSTVNRSLAVLLSVSSIGGGIAYLNTLCASRTTGYGYAVCGLNNNVTFPAATYVWDSDVTSHELGHNFGSSHTHSCSWGPPIDSCYAAEGGCFSGTTPRPGTIMSYCHLTASGTQLLFHPRVSTLIRNRAEAASCLSAANGSAANDLAATAIDVPRTGAQIAQNASLTPVGALRNVGTSTQSNVQVTFTMHDSAGTQIYSVNRTIASIAPGADATVTFTTTSIGTLGRYRATMTVTLGNDSYQANNTLVRPFEVVASVNGNITLSSPNLPTKLRAGAASTISWSSSGVTSLLVELTPDDGATWRMEHNNTPASSGSTAWSVPSIATTRGRIRLSDRSNAAIEDRSDSTFTITTLPVDWQWGREVGGPGGEVTARVAVDTNGWSWVAATFVDSVRLGGTTYVSRGGSDILVARYSPGGTLQWASSFGSAGNDEATAIAVDGNGNSFVVGSFSLVATFGPSTLSSAGGLDAFLLALDRNGTVRWVRGGGGSGSDVARGVAIDAGANVVTTGMATGNATFGAASMAGQGGDIFVTRYNGAGSLLWLRAAGGSGTDEGMAVATDGSGNVHVTGRYGGTATFSTTTLPHAGGDDAFVAKYNASGTLQWVRSGSGSGNEIGRGIAVDAAGEVAVGGTLNGPTQFGTVPTSSAGGSDMFLARYRSTGTLLWLRRAGSSGNDEVGAITMDDVGNCFVGGSFENAFDLGSLRLTATGTGGRDLYVAKYDPDGWPQWVIKGGTSRTEDGGDIAVLPGGAAAMVAGSFVGGGAASPYVVGDDSLAGAGSTDLLLARLALFRVTSPREGDIWRLGDSATITWTVTGEFARVNIDYSTNNGTSWTRLASGRPNDGSLRLLVPQDLTTQAVIRVSDADTPALGGSAESGTFTIESLAPATDLDAIGLDGRVYVTWSHSPAVGVTAYALYRSTVPGGTMTYLTTVGPNTPFYDDRGVLNCNQYAYGVKARIGNVESIMSNLDTARPAGVPALDVTSPDSTAAIPAGSSRTVTWGATGCIDGVLLDLSTDGGTTWTPIASTGNVGVYDWIVPTIPSTRAIIRMRDLADSLVEAFSDTFSICNPQVAITVEGPTDFCTGDSVLLAAPIGQKSYIWSTGDTTQSIIVKESGTYSVVVVDAANCSGASNASVTVRVRPELPKPTIEASDADLRLCAGESVTLTAPAGYGEYIWSTGALTRAIVVRESGRYTVRIGDSIGCSNASDEIEVVVNPLPAKPVIARIAGTDSVMVLDAATGVTYRWDVGGSILQGTSAAAILAASDGYYRVTVIDTNGCSVTSDTIFVTNLLSDVALATTGGAMRVTPNPSTGLIELRGEFTSGDRLEIALHDAAGRELIRRNAVVDPLRSVTLDLRALPDGSYFLLVRRGAEQWGMRVVKVAE